MKKWLDNIKKKKQEKREEERKRQLELQEKRRKIEEDRIKKEKDDAQYRQNIIDIIQSGKMPDINWHINNMPFKFMKSEKLVWVFDSVDYYEHKTRREFIGRSAGTSVRVAKGLSVRLGQSHGVPVEKDERVHRGMGPLAITTKHLYFSGNRIFRIPFSKIVSADTFSNNGLIITRDRASGHPESFVIGNLNFANISVNAEFACDLIHSIESSEVTPKSETIEPKEYHLLAMDNSGDYFE